MTGQQADRYSLFDKEERVSRRGVVITDSKGKELEVINSSLDSEDLALFTLNIVKQACTAPADPARPSKVGCGEREVVRQEMVQEAVRDKDQVPPSSQSKA